ncbi:fimbria/pilus periplasmic chaperone [Photobacterium leiognathi]|uniref:fimbria/pilus periplasmic chaperone n=1 Tax=Photobacterium leiognathi TaxID=553611 RepID=UPI0034E5F892
MTKSNNERRTKPFLLCTPPLFVMKGKERKFAQNCSVLIKMSLAKDRESLYWINVKASSEFI